MDEGKNATAQTPRPLNRKELSVYLLCKHGIRRSPKTLAKLAVIGGGPVFRRVGRHPMYAPVDVEQWVASITTIKVRSTSQLR